MCLAVPMKVLSIEGSEGRADLNGVRRTVMLDLVPEVAVGDYVIVHAGYAIERLDEEAALETLDLLAGVARANLEAELGPDATAPSDGGGDGAA